MAFSPPSGVTFHTADEIPVTALAAAVRGGVVFLQSLQVSLPRLRLYHDWWQHDGLHFDKGAVTFHDLFTMVETPRAIFEVTPDDHEVFIGIAPEDGRWYLRFRAEWDADDQTIVGRFAVTLPSDLADSFRAALSGSLKHPLVEDLAESYYKNVMI
jgi:hypothetical protein